VALLGPALWTRAGQPLAASAEVRVRAAGPVHVGLGVLIPGASTTQPLPAGGRARLDALPVLLRAMLERQRGPVAASAGLDAALSFETGRSLDIAQPASGHRVMLAAGASLGLAWLPTPRLRLALEATGLRLVAGSDFQVGGFGRVLDPPRWQGLVGLRAGWVFWP
jgi:hypothetical protein